MSSIRYHEILTDLQGKAIQDKFGFGERGEGVELVVECSGAEVCVQSGIWLVKRRGLCVQVGAGPADNMIPMSILVNKEVKLVGSLRVRIHFLSFSPSTQQVSDSSISTAPDAMPPPSTSFVKDA